MQLIPCFASGQGLKKSGKWENKNVRNGKNIKNSSKKIRLRREILHGGTFQSDKSQLIDKKNTVIDVSEQSRVTYI